MSAGGCWRQQQLDLHGVDLAARDEIAEEKAAADELGVANLWRRRSVERGGVRKEERTYLGLAVAQVNV